MTAKHKDRTGSGRFSAPRWTRGAVLCLAPLTSPPSAAQPVQAPPAGLQAGEVARPPEEQADTTRGDLGQAKPDTDPRPPTGILQELSAILPGIALKRKFDELAAETNIRFSVANTYLFQQATGGDGRRSAGGGDLDLLAKWTAVGAGTKDTGILAFAAETRYQIGDQAPSALSGEIGTLIPTTNGFGERPLTVKEAYWDQRLFEDRFRYALGRIDPENLFGGHRLQSANLYFLNKAFSSNPTIAFPGSGFAAAAQVKPAPWLYVDGGITDANGKTTVGNFEGFFEDNEFLLFGEAALTPTIEGVGAGRYRLAVWHIDEREDARRPSDEGFTLSFDQDFGDSLTAFLRYGHADGDATGVTNSVQGGVGVKGVLGEKHMLGFAVAWSEPADDSLSDEKVLEIFQRFQITETFQFTIGAEAIFDPSHAPDDEVLGVFSARLRVSF